MQTDTIERILDDARDIVLVALRGRPPRPCICILTAFRRQECLPR